MSEVPAMKPPASLVIAGQTFRVEVIDDPTSGVGRHGDEHTIGATNVDAGIMRVRGGKELSADQERDTLLHEVIHAVLSLTKLDGQRDHFKTSEASERIVTVLSTHLLDTLRRNPALVEYLVHG